ncbi:ABC transporter ATP-binding protein [Frigoribacterium sp. Leaf44]|jgi:ABC-2 type transport system ATP-binding protein|uniref:ABC transporter ATP-binding protein n=1 Tax=Frigoribacterium sp. Leaf44 TaxID=1736220 RepID=UPI000A5B1074|nr:ABC transporter ATP-binding protein [Frigoribacterium sp. Leaf44]
MAGRREDEVGDIAPDSTPGDDTVGAAGASDQGENTVDDDATTAGDVAEGTAATTEAPTPRVPVTKPSTARKPSAPRKPSSPRKPSQRTAADRSAAAKKAAATRAANARARAEAAARAAEEEVVAELADAGVTTEGTVVVPVSADDYFGDALTAEEESAAALDDALAGDSPSTAPDDDDTTTTDETVGDLSEAEDGVAVETERTSADEGSVRAAREVDAEAPVVLAISGLMKRYGGTVAVENVDLEVRAGSFYGIVGPNGAGKTTTLSIVTGLLRPDAGTVTVLGADVWRDPAAAKRSLGVLPDRLRLFDRLTGAQLLYYSATLRGLDGVTARKRSSDLATAFGLHDALGRLVSDYSVGMTKKIALAAAIIHSPRVLVLDEPFESVDPVSAATVTDVLQRYVAGGGTVLLSSHSMDLVERICDSVAVIVDGHVLASGTVDEVRAGRSLEQRFVELAGGRAVTEGMEWLQNFSD